MAYNEDSDDFLAQIEINVENSLTSVVKCINHISQTHHVSLQLLRKDKLLHDDDYT